MDIDAKDNLYVIAGAKEMSNEQWNHKMFVFDQNGNKILECLLPFLFQKGSLPFLSIAINTDWKIAICSGPSKMLYIGNLCDKFDVDKSFLLNEISDKFVRIGYLDSKIIAVGALKGKVYMYADDGQLERKLDMPEISPTNISYVSVAVNYITKRILLKMTDNKLFRFSETGELIDNLSLGCSEWLKYAKLVSHPNGAVALVGDKEFALLQL